MFLLDDYLIKIWGNTEWVVFIQQLFLMYLTVSGVAIFWIFIAILNDKINYSFIEK